MGHIWSAYVRETFPPTARFHASDVPDMTGKVVLVTGANSGIGKEIARVCPLSTLQYLPRPDDFIATLLGPPHKKRQGVRCVSRQGQG
jgi:hypothetical protein